MWFLLSQFLCAQVIIGCSNGVVSFIQYQPIIYPRLARLGGFDGTFVDVYELIIKPSGAFEYKLTDHLLEMKFDLFKKSIENALSGWHFANNTGKDLNLKMSVRFEFSGIVNVIDEKVLNQISFDQDRITITVITSHIILPARSQNSNGLQKQTVSGAGKRFFVL
jgi:hypothetical protein